MLEHFTPSTQFVLTLASEEAHAFKHSHVGTEHLLLGLIQENEGKAAKVLALNHISYEAAHSKIEELVGRGQNRSSRHSVFSVRLKRTLDLSYREMLQLGHSSIDTEHLLLGLLRFGEGTGIDVLLALGMDLRLLRQRLIMEMTGYRKQGDTPSDQTMLLDQRLALVDASKNASTAQLAAALRTLSATNDELEQLQGVFGGE